MNENPNVVKILEDNIIGFDKVREYGLNPGIYCWIINGEEFYIGESVEILNRSYYHMMNIHLYPEYWADVYNNGNIKKGSIEIKILEKVNRNDTKYKNVSKKKFKKILKEKEITWINKIKPTSQKCDGTDHTKPLEERSYILDMLYFDEDWDNGENLDDNVEILDYNIDNVGSNIIVVDDNNCNTNTNRNSLCTCENCNCNNKNIYLDSNPRSAILKTFIRYQLNKNNDVNGDKEEDREDEENNKNTNSLKLIKINAIYNNVNNDSNNV